MYTIEEKTNVQLLSTVLGVAEERLNMYELSEILKAPQSIAQFEDNEKEKIYALREITKRLMTESSKGKKTIIGPQSVAEILMPMLRYEIKEHFVVIILDTKNQVLAISTISIGSLNASIVHPREVFIEVLKYPSSSIILAHNHPSGNPNPSKEDLIVTKRLAGAGKILDIEVIDHIIIGDNKYLSMKSEGYMK